MNIRLVAKVVSSLLLIIGGVMLTAVPVGWMMNDSTESIMGMLGCALFTIVVAGFGRAVFHGKDDRFRFREGFGVVTFGWVFASLFGALPFVVVSDFYFYDGFFETMSGFSTTGSSVIDNTLVLMSGKTLPSGLADIPRGLLYWRSMTHWLGGMGIVVLSLAILPSLGISAHQLYKAEVPGPIDEQITPKIADSAKILWGVYVLLSVVETLLLYCCGMTLFQAWCHACGTMATGGFSTEQASVGAFHSAWIDWIITIFMFLAGANFVLHFRALRGRPISYFRDEEFLFYAGLTVIATLTITFSLMGGDIVTSAGERLTNVGFLEATRYSAFQVVSILTTTGFATADFNLWPAYAALALVFMMFIGGCGGSTGGGMKSARVILLIKYAVSQVERSIFRRSVSNVHLNWQRVSGLTLHKTLSFFFLFVGLYVVFCLALTFLGVNSMGEAEYSDGQGLEILADQARERHRVNAQGFTYVRSIASPDVLTAATASIAALGNIGPGLNKVGPVCSYAWMSPGAKLLLTLAMLLGRLELYTVLVVFLPTFWKR